MSGLIIICWIILIVLGIAMYLKFKPDSYQSMLLSKETAHAIASRFVSRYVGIDVTDWRYYAMYWHDRDMVNKLHHLGILNKVRATLYQWGLIEAWRIRYVSDNKSIIVGINANSEVTFLQVDVRRGDMPKSAGAVFAPEHLQQELAESPEGVWAHAKLMGEGNKEEDLEDIKTYWYLIESDEVRMKITAETKNGYILSMGTEQEIHTEQMNAAVKKEYMESTLNMSGVLGSFMAVVAALVALITLNLHTDMPVSIVAGVLMVLASVLTVKEDIQLSIVNAFDSRISVKMVYGLGILSALLASLASGFVVFICTLAGRPISDELGIPFLDKIGNQLLSGIAIGVACLGLFTFLFYALQRMGIVRISPELSDRTVYMSGFNIKQGLSVSLQSSIAEEVVYRLLTLPIVWWLTGNEYIAIAISSVLWAFLHQGTGYHPRSIRWAQLVCFGWILGLVYVHFGFLAVVTAHFIHNFILVFMPLVQYRFQISRGSVKTTKRTSVSS